MPLGGSTARAIPFVRKPPAAGAANIRVLPSARRQEVIATDAEALETKQRVAKRDVSSPQERVHLPSTIPITSPQPMGCRGTVGVRGALGVGVVVSLTTLPL